MSSPITTHVLDTSTGLPAVGVPVQLDIAHGEGWKPLAMGVTNDDGRVPQLMEGRLDEAVYRMSFDTGAWFTQQGTQGFYPEVRVVFVVTETERHHHVPLLLSPFGYSTYRGS